LFDEDGEAEAEKGREREREGERERDTLVTLLNASTYFRLGENVPLDRPVALYTITADGPVGSGRGARDAKDAEEAFSPQSATRPSGSRCVGVRRYA
jgi:hypothetical protein